MHTIHIGNKTYHVGDPKAADLLIEARRLAQQGRDLVSRGLISLALKIDNGTLATVRTRSLTKAIQAAL